MVGAFDEAQSSKAKVLCKKSQVRRVRAVKPVLVDGLITSQSLPSACSAALPTPRCFLSLPELPPVVEPPSKKAKIEESFELSEQQQQLIREDTANKKLWDEALDGLKEGPV